MNIEIKDDINNKLHNRIRLLKTGLFGVHRFINFRMNENRAFFEQIAEPGTELMLKRVYDDPNNIFRIDVYYDANIKLGTVTKSKSQTIARLIDAGLEIIAIVNNAIPEHDSDTSDLSFEDDEIYKGWTIEGRIKNDYRFVSLPYGIYLIDRE